MAILKKGLKKKNNQKIMYYLSFKFLKRTSIYYFLRLTRLEASIYAISSGFACGAMVSFTPFIGFHFVLALVVSFILRGNLLASMIGTIVGNPITFPFIWLTIYRIGIVFVEQKEINRKVELNLENVLNGGWEILFPMLIGSAILCLPVWFISYFVIRFLLTSFKKKSK